MLYEIKQQIAEALTKVGVENAEFTTPPNSEMGDLAFGCFEIAKIQKKNPAEVAKDLVEKLNELFTKEDMKQSSLISKVEAAGPYVNFFLDEKELAQFIPAGIKEDYGEHDLGANKKILVEFGCPNPLKVFHLGHLKNLITGESVARVFSNAGYDVVRVNYQGDVGMHVAKALWGVMQNDELKMMNDKKNSLQDKVKYLGQAYARGAKAFEEDEEAKKEILEMNKKVYERDESIQVMYHETRKWSLEYFDQIYKKLGTGFDRLYFESEVFERAIEIVKEFLAQDVFQESEGAVIFPGSKYDLHDRVFLNSEGFPTYEAKDLGLAEMHFHEYNPDKIIHVVGKEQIGYFQVVFKALEAVLPESKGKEYHLPGGYLQLKGAKKMSSRTGDVIAGDDLLAATRKRVEEIMGERELSNREEVVDKVTSAVLKYAMLKADITQDVAFDMEESVSTSGDSGPYLLYIVARIKSILRKTKKISDFRFQISDSVELEEKKLLLKLAEYPEVTKLAVDNYDPSKISKYLFELAQIFNVFYTACPVLKAEKDVQAFRVDLIRKVELVMTKGLGLLGVETVEEM